MRAGTALAAFCRRYMSLIAQIPPTEERAAAAPRDALSSTTATIRRRRPVDKAVAIHSGLCVSVASPVHVSPRQGIPLRFRAAGNRASDEPRGPGL